MEHAQQITIEDNYLQLLTLNVYPKGELKTLYTHARETLKQFTDICVDMPLIPGDRYNGLYEILAENRTCCVLQFDPLIDTNAPIRLTIKPAVGGDEARRHIQRVLVEVFGLEYEQHMGTTKIVGFELIMDIQGTALEDLVFFDEAKRVSNRKYDEQGRLCEIQLGSETSDERIIITDNPKKESHKGLIDKKPKTISSAIRITARVKKANTPLQSAHLMSNPLAGLSIIRLPPALKGEGTTAWLGFLDSCRYRGMQAALARIPQSELRKKFRTRIGHQLAVSWWHPSVIWLGFPGMVSALGLLSVAPTKQLSHADARTKTDAKGLDDDEDYDDC